MLVSEKQQQYFIMLYIVLYRQTINDKETSTVSTVDKPVVTVDKTSHQGKETEYVLSKWLVKPLAKGICVVGLNR